MLDRDRVLSKLDEMRGYLRELAQVVPARFEDYDRVESRRSCERLLQLAIECVIDTCGILVAGLRLGVPAEEDDLFEKLARAEVVSEEMAESLRRMKGFRNLLVHEYGRVDDRKVYELARDRVSDFEGFAAAVLAEIRRDR